MSLTRINCETANKIYLITLLKQLGYISKKENEKEAWYLSPFRQEKTPSFKISKQHNVWYCFSEGVGGTVIDFMMKYRSFTIIESLDFLSEESALFSFQKQKSTIEDPKGYSIDKIQPLNNPVLINYFLERKISNSIAKKYCLEIYYTLNQKHYFAIAFKNISGGYEIRNKYFKGCLGKKGITHLKKGYNTVSVFESFSDFLSYCTIKENEELEEDFIISNSTALIEKVKLRLIGYSRVKLFFDNDNSGKKAAKSIMDSFKSKCYNQSYYYKNFKDLNEYLIELKTT